ncbi:MAG: hypothetical protein DLM73_01755 [Chthoniobacterales bacterium]|nr:MAG: hypothetical protein DLM73_01755 [Chthoniobacterales bacterium]
MRIVLSVTGDLAAEAAADSRSVVLRDRAGSRVSTYDHLKAWDATGRELPAAMRAHGQEIALEVDDAGASYPVTIDPMLWQQQAQLTAGGGLASDYFGIVAALFEGKPGAVYNFGGDSEMPNIETVKLILWKLGKPESLISYVTDRLGHDRRYAIDSSFAQRELKWKPLHNFKEGLDSTIDWYANHRSWWEPLLERTGRH